MKIRADRQLKRAKMQKPRTRLVWREPERDTIKKVILIRIDSDTMNGVIKKKGLFRVSVYLNENEFTAIAQLAEKLGFRAKGIQTRRQKPHGFSGEWIAGTKGISETYKYLAEYYSKTEAYRLTEAARIAQERERLEREAHEKGLGALFSMPEKTENKRGL